jgi:hypothetical protein
VELGSVIGGGRAGERRVRLLGAHRVRRWVVLAVCLGAAAFVIAFAVGWASDARTPAKPEPVAAGSSATRMEVSGLVAMPSVPQLRLARKHHRVRHRASVASRAARKSSSRGAAAPASPGPQSSATAPPSARTAPSAPASTSASTPSAALPRDGGGSPGGGHRAGTPGTSRGTGLSSGTAGVPSNTGTSSGHG